MKCFIVHFKNGEKLRVDLGDGGTLKFEGDIARFEDAGETALAVHMREAWCIRSAEARIRQLQPHDEE